MRTYFIYITILFLLQLRVALSDDSYPLTYSFYELHEGGKLVISSKDKETANPLFFFLKPSWAGKDELISVWKGIKPENIKGSPFRGLNILASLALDNSILLIWKDKQKFYTALIDSNTDIVSIAEIHIDANEYITDVKFIPMQFGNSILILLGQNLYLCKIDKNNQVILDFISKNVNSATEIYNNKKYKIAYLVKSNGWSEIHFSDIKGNDKICARIQLSYITYLHPFADKVGIVSTNLNSNKSWLHLIDSEKGVVAKNDIDANGKFIHVSNLNNTTLILKLLNNENGYILSKAKLKTTGYNLVWADYYLPKGLIEAKGLWLQNESIFVMFRNGLVELDIDGKLLSYDYFPFGEYFNNTPDLTIFDNYILFSSKNSSIIFKKNSNRFWYVNQFIKSTGKIAIPLILLIIVILLISKYLSQRRLLNAVLRLPSTGVVFVIDNNGRLRSANGKGKEMLSITGDVPMRRLFQSYCELDSTFTLKTLVEKALSLRDTFSQKINIISNGINKEWLFTVNPLRNLTGKFKGNVITGIDITEELERKRLNNWAQLAHDMQTNLSTIRLNAEQLDLNSETVNSQRRKKIVHQANLLIHRIRDIVTVGRSDAPEREYVNAADICLEVRNEFDSTVFPNVKFELQILDFYLYCDKPKMIRALRNAIENGIRSIEKDKGTINISNRKDSKYAYFSVSDTGKGMNEEKKKRMMTPYFSTSAREGGAGIGTMIMQSVMEQHGGELIVNSEPEKGTDIVFCIPQIERKLNKDNKSNG